MGGRWSTARALPCMLCGVLAALAARDRQPVQAQQSDQAVPANHSSWTTVSCTCSRMALQLRACWLFAGTFKRATCMRQGCPTVTSQSSLFST